MGHGKGTRQGNGEGTERFEVHMQTLSPGRLGLHVADDDVLASHMSMPNKLTRAGYTRIILRVRFEHKGPEETRDALLWSVLVLRHVYLRLVCHRATKRDVHHLPEHHSAIRFPHEDIGTPKYCRCRTHIQSRCCAHLLVSKQQLLPHHARWPATPGDRVYVRILNHVPRRNAGAITCAGVQNVLGSGQIRPDELLPGWKGACITIRREIVKHLLPFALSGKQLDAAQQAPQPSPYCTKHFVLPPQPVFPSQSCRWLSHWTRVEQALARPLRQPCGRL
jgi:hypothetical protein